MRASVFLLAVALAGCATDTRLILEPDSYTGRTLFYHGPRHAFRVLDSAAVNAALQERDGAWGGIDRLDIVRASGEQVEMRPDASGVQIRDGALVVRSGGRAEALPLVGIGLFVARDRRTPLERLRRTVSGGLGGAIIGAALAAVTDGSFARNATVGAAVGTGAGVYTSRSDKDRYDVYVGDFEAP